MELQSERSRLAAFLLAFFIGQFGAHRFYAGKTKSAIVQLCLTITLIGLPVSLIWAFVDWITIACGNFKDVDNIKITKW